MTYKTETLSSDTWTQHPDNLRISLMCPVVEFGSPAHTQTTTSGLEIAVPATNDFFGDLSKVSRQKPSTRPATPSQKRRADAISDEIHSAVDRAGTTSDNSPKPTNDTAGMAIGLIGAVRPDSLLGKPDVDTLNGEINLTWNDGEKQIIVICHFGHDALVHHHQHIKGKPSKHGIEKATSKSLTQWLRWLHE